MTATIPLIPENAPFSGAQRAWLNGFFSAIFNAAGTAGPATQVSQAMTKLAAPAEPVVEEEDFPWHDATLPMVERLKLAENKPRPRVLMAAMAQLDCGACGYLCKTYAEAI